MSNRAAAQKIGNLGLCTGGDSALSFFLSGFLDSLLADNPND